MLRLITLLCALAFWSGSAFAQGGNAPLLITYTNPTPVSSDFFGASVAAFGSDRVLISADGAGGYLFSTSGTLLTMFTNPTPAAYDYFGWSVSAVGSSRVLIGAYWDGSDVFRSGSAYLFSTNGTLLNTLTNPTPVASDQFGWSVAAVGSDRVIIGSLFDDTGAPDSGAAYLFDLPYPSLSIARNATSVSIKWVTPETGLTLQEADRLGTSLIWSNTSGPVSIHGNTNSVQHAPESTNRFFRLHRP